MRLFEHPVYGRKIPWLCRLRLHFSHSVSNGSWQSWKCSRCGWEE